MANIVVIGPIVPYLGGITHSNTTLCINLSKNNNVLAISFSMMFPKFLYPGKVQKKGKPAKNTPYKQKFILNTLNPISWYRVCKEIKTFEADWVVFQWWHTYFFPCYVFITLFIRFFSKAKTNVMCQNVLPHEEGFIQTFIHKPFAKIFYSLVNHVVAMSVSELKILNNLVPNIKKDFIVEGLYEIVKKKSILLPKARKSLGLNQKEKIVLFFGAVRDYKGLDYLIDGFSCACKKVPNMRLLIVGAFWEPKEKFKRQIKNLGITNKVTIWDGYLPDEKIPALFCAVDILVLAHTSSTESGIPQISYLYNTPMIATNVGSHPDVINNNKSGFLVSIKNSNAIAEAIISFFKNKKSKLFKLQMQKDKKLFEWTTEKEKKFFGLS